MWDDALLMLLVTLAQLSLLAIGGIYVVLPELYRLTVETQAWMTDGEFSALFALSQAAPGPNMMFVTLLGWRLGGVAGGVAATGAFLMPALTLVVIVARMWNRWGERRWFVVLRNGLVPVTIGLMIASAWLLIGATAVSPGGYAIIAASMAATLAARAHPVIVLSCAGILGAFGFV